MKRIALIPVLLAACVFGVTLANGGATYYVNAGTGDNSFNGTAPGTPWKSISYALTNTVSAVASGDVVNVASGLYTNSPEVFPLPMKNGVTLQGAGWMTTIIDAKSGGTTVINCSSVGSGKIDGFTIKGAGPGDDVSGLRLTSSSPTISNNRIARNYDWRKGGGIWCNSSSPLIKNNLIVANHAGSTTVGGGGIYLNNSSPTILNCTIVGNSSSGSATAGGGIFAEGSSSPVIRDCIIWQNGDDLSGITSSQISYCDIEDGDFNGTSNNISADPLFVAGYLLSHTLTGQAVNSPCVGTGSQTASAAGLDTLSTRTDGMANGGQVDMGFHFSTGTTYGVTVYVATNGSNAYTLSQATNATTPWKTITYALSQASTAAPPFGWTINVDSGIYNDALGESFPLNMSDGITLQGAGCRTTIIQSSSSYKIKCVTSGIGVIDGFSIRSVGRNDFITGIYCDGSFPQISHCTILSNLCHQGYAGAMYIFRGSCPVIKNNVIAYNSARRSSTGGSISAIYCYDSGTCPIIQNNTVYSNINYDASASVYGDGISAQNFAAPTIVNCIVWSNQAPDLYGVTAGMISYSDVSDGQFNTTNGCISADPLLASPGALDFHEKSGGGTWNGSGWTKYAVHSPCIDAGDTNSVYSLEPDFNGKRINMGAYGNTVEAGLTKIERGSFILLN